MGDISEKAKFRLAFIEFYNNLKDVSLTCKTFKISRPTFYKWHKRYNPKDLSSLEDRSRAPKAKRKSTLTLDQELKIKKLRENHKTWGKVKLQVRYKKKYGEYVSQNHIQQVINKYDIYPAEDKVDRTKKKKTTRKKIRINTISPNDYISEEKPFFVAVDTIVLYLPYGKRYILTAIDHFNKLAYARVYKSHSSAKALDFLLRLQVLTGSRIAAVLSDNGSEFEKHFEGGCKKLGIQHIYTRNNTPKDNAICERFNGTLRRDFIRLDADFDALLAEDDLTQANEKLTEWLVTYNFKRPHQNLDNLTPMEYICEDPVLTMYPPRTIICNFKKISLFLYYEHFWKSKRN